MDLGGLAPGSRLGRLRVESSDGDRLDLEMRLLSQAGGNRCDFEIVAEASEYADLPLAKGTLENTGTAFELEIQLMDWLIDLSRRLAVPQSLAAEIDFDIPLRTHDEELSLSVSATH